MRCGFYVLLASLFLPQLRGQDLPNPVLAYQGSSDNGAGFTQHKFAITNYSDYSSELFQPAPDLPPCGRNRDASRTWIDILDAAGARIYGFCALRSPMELQRLWFAWKTGTAPPSPIRIVLTDRRTGHTAEGRLEIPSAGVQR